MKTENSADVGRHAFEVAGLGLAPFRFVGFSENVITHPDGTQQAGGCCDYCGTGLRFECHVVSRDGRGHKVGTNCIAKVGDAGLLQAYKKSPEYRAHQRQLAALRAKAVQAELVTILDSRKAEFAARPHPYNFVNRETGASLTYLDYVTYSLNCCGAAGRAGWLKFFKTEGAATA